MSTFLDKLPSLAVLIMGGVLGWVASSLRWSLLDAARRGRKRASDARYALGAFLSRLVLVAATLIVGMAVLALVYVNLPHD